MPVCWSVTDPPAFFQLEGPVSHSSARIGSCNHPWPGTESLRCAIYYVARWVRGIVSSAPPLFLLTVSHVVVLTGNRNTYIFYAPLISLSDMSFETGKMSSL